MTYTDDSYTTLLNDDSLNVSNLEAYATSLPWYSRIQADAGGKGSASGSASGSGSAKSTASAENLVAQVLLLQALQVVPLLKVV